MGDRVLDRAQPFGHGDEPHDLHGADQPRALRVPSARRERGRRWRLVEHGDGNAAILRWNAGPAGAVAVDAQRKIDAQWTKPADNGDHINTYRLQHRVKGSSDWTTITINPDNLSDLPDPPNPPNPEQPYPPSWWVPNVPTSHSIDGLPNATTREVRVRASNDSGLGRWSEVIEARPGESQAPTAPRQLTLSPGITTIRANWVRPGNDRGSAVTDYDVEYRETGNTSWTDVPHTTGTERAIAGLTNGNTYDVRVRAENTTGNGAWLAQTVTLPMVEPGVELLETTMTVGVQGASPATRGTAPGSSASWVTTRSPWTEPTTRSPNC